MKAKSGMKSPTMPKDHFEKKEGALGHQSKLKYTEGMDNAGKLDQANSALANYAKKNKMKY